MNSTIFISSWFR